MKALLLVALAGGLGAVCRYLLGGILQQHGERVFGAAFPYGTFVVNVLGCFAFGLVTALLAGRLRLGPEARLLALTGFMGAFTTFSTYAHDLAGMLTSGRYGAFALSFLGQNVLGLLAVLLGLFLGRGGS